MKGLPGKLVRVVGSVVRHIFRVLCCCFENRLAQRSLRVAQARNQETDGVPVEGYDNLELDAFSPREINWSKKSCYKSKQTFKCIDER